MKSKISFTLILMISTLVLLANIHGYSQSSDKTVVYYFHGQFRCHSCMRIEELTKKALQSGFSKELASGSIIFRPTNIDVVKNEHYMSDYRLSTRSVVLSKIQNGKQVNWRNLAEVWSRLNNESSFISYIQNEVRSFNK